MKELVGFLLDYGVVLTAWLLMAGYIAYFMYEFFVIKPHRYMEPEELFRRYCELERQRKQRRERGQFTERN